MIKFRIHMIVLCNFLLWHNSVISSVLVGSLIKTTHGFVSVENLCVGDELIILSDNQNITTCRVKEITVTTTNTIIEIVTDPVTIRAISDQLFYDPMYANMDSGKRHYKR